MEGDGAAPVPTTQEGSSGGSGGEGEGAGKAQWLPLESNPAMLNEFCRRVGLPAASGWGFHDIWGLDPELLLMVPGAASCRAVTLLFDHRSEALRAAHAAEHERIKDGGTGGEGAAAPPDSLVFIKQYVGNACGTIAATHILANCAADLGIAPDSALGSFLGKTAGAAPADRGHALAREAGMHAVSEACAAGGNAQTAAPELGDRVDFHFIAFVLGADGAVYELDGRKARAVHHGAVPPGEMFLAAAGRVIREKFMAVDPALQMWNMMAFVKED